MAIDVEKALEVAEAIVNGIMTVAPAVQKGVASAEPYIKALGGLLTGSNATQEDIDDLLAKLQADSAEFEQPLPPDDGQTTT
jgi:hypothetical protein